MTPLGIEPEAFQFVAQYLNLLHHTNMYSSLKFWLILVAARCKVWVCRRSFAGIVSLNPAGGMDVCLLRVLCFVT
jgi:hypothetical protein